MVGNSYFEGGISSVYFWDVDDGFAGCILLKKGMYSLHGMTCSILTPCTFKDVSSSVKSSGSWDSIHVFESQDRARLAHYKLTSTVILSLGTYSESVGSMDLSGNMVRQVEQDMVVENDGSHVTNIGKVNKIRM